MKMILPVEINPHEDGVHCSECNQRHGGFDCDNFGYLDWSAVNGYLRDPDCIGRAVPVENKPYSGYGDCDNCPHRLKQYRESEIREKG